MPLTYAFRQWLGRDLNLPERKIIYALEYQRKHLGYVRVSVTDKGRFDSRPILLCYMDWIIGRLYPDREMALIAPGRAQAYSWGAKMRCHPYLGYATSPNRLRGATFHAALLLDAQFYGFGGWLLRTVIGPIPVEGGIVIVHSRAHRGYMPEIYVPSTDYLPPPSPPRNPAGPSGPDNVEIIYFFPTSSPMQPQGDTLPCPWVKDG